MSKNCVKNILFRFLLIFLLFLQVYAADSAGIIFYAFKDGNAYLLLTKDTHHDALGAWTDCGGKVEAGTVLKNAAKEGYEESMGVFLNPPSGIAISNPEAYDPHPEINEKGNIDTIKQWIQSRGLAFERRFYGGGKYSGWFLMVDFIEEIYFKNALDNLKKRNVAWHYVEKGGYAWVNANNFLGIKSKKKGDPVSKVRADFPNIDIDVYSIFITTISQKDPQTHLNNIITAAGKAEAEKEAKEEEAKKALLKPNVLLTDLQPKLTQLKQSLTILKNKLGRLSEKLVTLKSLLGVVTSESAKPLVSQDINIDGKKYCTVEFWHLNELEKKMAGSQPAGIKPTFNVIFWPNKKGQLAQFKKYADLSALMKNPLNNGAVFQIAANDSLPYTWAEGGAQAGSVVDATELGSQIRKIKGWNESDLQKNVKFKYTLLGTEGAYADNINNIVIAIHSDLSVIGVPGQVVHVPFVAAYDARSGVLQNRTEKCLKVAYDGTLLSAVKLKTRKVFLCLMGIGVFKNPYDLAVDAVVNAVNLYAKKNYNLNVTLCLWNPFSKDDLNHKKIVDTVKSVGGYICDIKGNYADIRYYGDNGNITEDKNVSGDGSAGWATTDQLSQKLFGQ